MERPVYSVTELNIILKSYIEGSGAFDDICVCGEISNYKLYPSGHHYFTLKDADSSLSCVLFKGSAYSLRFRPENGMSIFAVGKISVYPRDGKYQLICSLLHPAGAGDLQVAFEQLKKKLEAEGLFDPQYKKPLPQFPERIALITSPAGAAVQDMIRILGARWPMSEIVIVPVRVQGEEAPGQICAAIDYVNQNSLAELIITGRGGGSIEDLWAFNEECVARAIFRSEIPVISAVGHEPDVCISDYVADRRASTPSNAAEIGVPDQSEISALLAAYSYRLESSLKKRLSDARAKTDYYANKAVLHDASGFINLRRMELDSVQDRMGMIMERKLNAAKNRFSGLAAGLDAMSPFKVLARGYSIVTDEEGRGVKSTTELQTGSRINVSLQDGVLGCTVNEIKVNAGE